MRLGRTVAVVGLMLSLVPAASFSARPAPVARVGQITQLSPPGNFGGHPGSGKIREDVTGDTYVFRTPTDLKSLPILTGDRVTFDSPGGRRATNVTVVPE